MVRFCLSLCLFFLSLGLGSPAWASGCCYETKQWKIARENYDGYSNSVALVPGNDTRVNLLLLIADRNRTPGIEIIRQKKPTEQFENENRYYVPNEARLFKWRSFRESLARPIGLAADGAGEESDACSSSPIVAFQSGVSAARGISTAEKGRLFTFRRSIDPECAAKGAPPASAMETTSFSKFAEPFAFYVEAVRAFDAGDHASALNRFAQLYESREPWVKETANYMLARTLLRLASDGAIDEYGSPRPGEKDLLDQFNRAERAMRLYLRRYPEGRYAASMRGLFRRLYWLKGDRAALAVEYQALFALRDPVKRGLSDVELAEEIDNKMFGSYELQLKPNETRDPLILAVLDLVNMRSNDFAAAYAGQVRKESRISRAEIEAQRPLFASETALFDFLLASHAYYVEKKPAEVLTLIPGAARQGRFSYLEFSRQMLRGLALDATKDPKAPSFWRDMETGAVQPYQRKALEMAIAMSAERRRDLAPLFAADSPVRDPFVRKMILAYVAGPDLLRQQAANKQISAEEREIALLTLLYKELAQGRHEDFLRDVVLITPDIRRGDHLSFTDLERNDLRTRLPALEKFKQPYGLFPCPPLAETVSKLAKSPRYAAGQLCVSEFMRVNFLFNFLLDTPMPKDELGGGVGQFPGAPYSRLEVYKAVIASAAATANDKAFALYRAVYCYDNGSNDCGGAEVEPPVRAAWFRRLKRDYPGTRWAKMADYYW
jgi:hypothetical protein